MPTLSFEYFPAANDVQHAKLSDVVDRLDYWQPDFISITYGAAGSTRDRTFESVTEFNENPLRKVAAHITAAGLESEDILDLADRYWQLGIHDLVALRGDARPKATNPKNGYQYASDLVKGLKDQHDFTVRVATYPEKHPESSSLNDDLNALKIKFDNGADEAITQFFFDSEVFLRFRDKAVRQGIDENKLIPGILPIKNFAQTARFAGQCHTLIPTSVQQQFEQAADCPLQPMVAAEFAAKLCHDLQQEGIDKFHFYTLNDDTRTHLTLENLEWFPQEKSNLDEPTTSGGDITPRRTG